jgi:hypothetical protein
LHPKSAGTVSAGCERQTSGWNKAVKDLPEIWIMAMMLDKDRAGEWTEEQREDARERHRARLLEVTDLNTCGTVFAELNNGEAQIAK